MNNADTGPVDHGDPGFPGKPAEGWPENPYDEDGYCEFCGNGSWKPHAPWCQWQDAKDAAHNDGSRTLIARLSVRRLR